MSDLFGRFMKLYKQLQQAGRVEKIGEYKEGADEVPIYVVQPSKGEEFYYYSPLPSGKNNQGTFEIPLKDREVPVNVYSPPRAAIDDESREALLELEAFLRANNA